MSQYLWQEAQWPHFIWDSESLIDQLAEVRLHQGLLLGKMQSLCVELRVSGTLETLTEEAYHSAAIEGEQLSKRGIRSSLANRLGLENEPFIAADQRAESMASLLLDAVQHADAPVTHERLYGWHAALFPIGYSGPYRIEVGRYRSDTTDPMQIVSGPIGRERVHFQAPPAERIPAEMDALLAYLENDQSVDPMIQTGLLHLWFETIHPFDDGNGRLGRALIDLQLTRIDGLSERYYSMSSQILRDRKGYYAQLAAAQQSELDITDWLSWFLQTLLRAIQHADHILGAIVQRQHFWIGYQHLSFHPRQQRVLQKLLEDFQGKLTAAKWAKLAKSSRDTALRDIQDLIDKGVLRKTAAGGRSTAYELIHPEKID